MPGGLLDTQSPSFIKTSSPVVGRSTLPDKSLTSNQISPTIATITLTLQLQFFVLKFSYSGWSLSLQILDFCFAISIRQYGLSHLFVHHLWKEEKISKTETLGVRNLFLLNLVKKKKFGKYCKRWVEGLGVMVLGRVRIGDCKLIESGKVRLSWFAFTSTAIMYLDFHRAP